MAISTAINYSFFVSPFFNFSKLTNLHLKNHSHFPLFNYQLQLIKKEKKKHKKLRPCWANN